jgi:hypothetical protein
MSEIAEIKKDWTIEAMKIIQDMTNIAISALQANEIKLCDVMDMAKNTTTIFTDKVKFPDVDSIIKITW